MASLDVWAQSHRFRTKEAKMNGENSRVRYVWILGASILILSLFLAGCGTAEPSAEEPDWAATIGAVEEQVHQLETQVAATSDLPSQESPVPPTIELDARATANALEEQVRQLETQLATTPCHLQEEACRNPAVLEISGIDTRGMPSTLSINADDTVLLPRFNQNSLAYLTETYTKPAYLEYALVFDEGENWQLFYAQPPAGTIAPMRNITPTLTRMHLLEWAGANQSLFISSPGYAVSGVFPISTPDEAESPIAFQDGVNLIKDALGGHVPTGQVFSKPTAFFLLSNGVATEPQYTLILFGPVQPDGDLEPAFPGATDDLENFCATSADPPFWCSWFW
jgi:hypothetical protein